MKQRKELLWLLDSILKVILDINTDDFYTEEISKKLTGSLLNYHQDFDLLSYSDEDIPGVTLPNF